MRWPLQYPTMSSTLVDRAVSTLKRSHSYRFLRANSADLIGRTFALTLEANIQRVCKEIDSLSYLSQLLAFLRSSGKTPIFNERFKKKPAMVAPFATRRKLTSNHVHIKDVNWIPAFLTENYPALKCSAMFN
jgi:hypothetical protein